MERINHAKKFDLFIVLIFMLLLNLSCSPNKPIQTYSQGDVLFQDNFSDTSSGWDRTNNISAITDYENGGYRIFVGDSNSDYFSNPGFTFNDVQIQVEAKKIGGPEDNDFGVICRYTDEENFYFFIISSDGYFSIGKRSNGEISLIGNEQMEYSEDINRGGESNLVTAICSQDKLTLMVNGKLLIQTNDPDFSSGDVGLIAGTFKDPGTDILFDNFSVTKP